MTDRVRVPESVRADLSMATALIQEDPDDLAALDQALRHLMIATTHDDFRRSDADFQAMIMAVVAAAYELRYRITGDLDDLSKQIEYQERELDLTPEGSPAAFSKRIHLAGRLLDRDDRTTTSVDLDRAISMLREVISRAPTDLPDRVLARMNLGSGLARRSSQIGDISDLGEAIDLLHDVSNALPPGDQNLPVALSILGSALFDRFRHSRNPADLDGSVATLRRAVALTGEGGPRLHSRLVNLAVALGKRYEQSGHAEDLDESIATLERQIWTSPDRDLHAIFLNLSIALKHRYEASSSARDLARAVEYALQAIDHLDLESPNRLPVLANAGSILMDRYNVGRDVQDLNDAIASWEQLQREKHEVTLSMPLPRSLHVDQGWAWVQPRLIEAYIERSSLVPGEEAAILRRIVELAEASKAPLLTSFAGRGSLPVPDTIRGELREEEAELLQQLRRIDSAELATRGEPNRQLSEIRDTGSYSFIVLDEGESYPDIMRAIHTTLLRPEDRRRERIDTLADLNDLWAEMGELGPEAARYVSLRRQGPAEFAQISNVISGLGAETAVLSFSITSQRTLVFIFREGQEMAHVQVPLTGADWDDVQRRLSYEMNEMEDLTPGSGRGRWIPSIRSLLASASPYLDGVDRIVIAPDGAAHLIPWSAVVREAGLRARDSSPMPVVVLPSLTLLPVLRLRALATDPTRKNIGSRSEPEANGQLATGAAVVVGNPTRDLESAELEAVEVGKLLRTQPLVGEEATTSNVIFSLSDARIIHIASHAEFVTDSPLDSGILLSDGALTARAAMALEIAPDLIVASACQTGTAHGVTGEEFANLAHAFLAAGARSMVVSLWDVDDISTAQLMTSFYGGLRQGLDKARALNAAIEVVRSDHARRDPFFWGGFVLLGDWE
jgi:tetratricopeptide (TPR) repeat protein